MPATEMTLDHNRIHRYLHRHRMSIHTLATKAGVSFDAVNNALRGRCSDKTVTAIEKAMGLQPGDLYILHKQRRPVAMYRPQSYRLNGCPRCYGDLMPDYDHARRCVQCGHTQYLKAANS